MLKICRADCKHYTSNARCGKTIGDRGRREPPSYDLREFRDAKRTADRGDPHKHNLTEREREREREIYIVHGAPQMIASTFATACGV